MLIIKDAPYGYLVRNSGTGKFHLFLAVPHSEDKVVNFGNLTTRPGPQGQTQYYIKIDISASLNKVQEDYNYKQYVLDQKSENAIVVECYDEPLRLTRFLVMDFDNVDQEQGNQIANGDTAFDCPYLFIANFGMRDKPQVFIPLNATEYQPDNSKEQTNCLGPTYATISLYQVPLHNKIAEPATINNSQACLIRPLFLEDFEITVDVYSDSNLTDPPKKKKKAKAAGQVKIQIYVGVGFPGVCVINFFRKYFGKYFGKLFS